MRDPAASHFCPFPNAAGIVTRLAYARAEAAGVDTASLLKMSGLTLRQIEDPSIRLRVRDQIGFLNHAAEELGDELLGFHLALSPDLRQFGLIYYVAASSEVLGTAVQRVARYCSIINEGIALKYSESKEVVVAVRYVGVSRHKDRHQIEFFMTVLVRLCRQLIGHRLAASRVSLTHHRAGASAELCDFFGGEVEFGAQVDEIAFAPTAKQMPVVSADPYLNNHLTAYFEEALSRRSQNRGTFRSNVENAMAPLLPHGKARASDGKALPRNMRSGGY